MKDEMMAKIMDEVKKKMGGTEAPAQSMACEAPQGINEDLCGLTEYVGTAMGHTIGLVIANLDYSVHELLIIDQTRTNSIVVRSFLRLYVVLGLRGWKLLYQLYLQQLYLRLQMP